MAHLIRFNFPIKDKEKCPKNNSSTSYQLAKVINQ